MYILPLYKPNQQLAVCHYNSEQGVLNLKLGKNYSKERMGGSTIRHRFQGKSIM